MMNLRTPLVLLLCFVALLPLSLFAQDDEPSQAPTTDLFSLESDQVGLFQNSVNLFTGEVAFSLPLVNLPGRGGLNAGVGIAYSSAGVRQQVETWNLEAPTGILGLGWRLDIPKVVVDHKSTGTRTDDDYYLIEGGVTNPLVVTKKEDGIRHFASTNYKFWDIQYRENSETWTIIKEDGTAFIYGDQNSERQTVQYLVKWGNWIGSSSEPSGQAQQAMQWDLSEIRNIYGDAVTFTYEQALQKVGSAAGKEHTEASYLTEIKNPQGQVITLVYADKDDGRKTGNVEYQEPHTEASEPDAYQERYEKKFLDAIEVRHQADEEPRYQIMLGYVLSGSGDFTKRLLTSVQKTEGDGSSLLPPIEFAYKPTGEQKGAMEVVTTSQGPQIEYTYGSVVVDGSRREFTVHPSEIGYAEPQTWIGNDYVVVAWRELNNGNHDGGRRKVKLRVYQWAGRWIEGPEVEIDDIELANNRYKFFEVALGKDFFGVTYYNPVKPSWQAKLFHQKETVGEWKVDTYSIEGGRGSIHAGNNFLAVATARPGEGGLPQLKMYTWAGSYWKEDILYDGDGDFFYTATNNYIIVHNRDIDPNEVKIHYQDELGAWKSKRLPDELSYYNRDVEDYEQASSYWHSTNGMAVWMAARQPEVIVQWDENYNLRVDKTTLGGWEDRSPVYMNNSMIGIRERYFVRMFQYDGKQWHDSRNFPYTPSSILTEEAYTSFGGNALLRTIPIDEHEDEGRIEWFDPNNSAWNTYSLGNIQYASQSVNMSSQYGYFTGKYFFQASNGEWAELAHQDVFDDNLSDLHWQHGGKITAYRDAHKTQVVIPRNGTITDSDTYTIFPKTIIKSASNVWSSPLIGSNIVITYPNNNDEKLFYNARSLTLHKWVDLSLTGQQIAYPVTKVTVHNGYQELPTTYAYTASSATMSAGGYMAQFNKVTVIPGSSDIEVIPYGYTEHYFFNGLPAESIGPIPTPVYIPGNGNTPYSQLIGVPYVTYSYNSQKELVAQHQNDWAVSSKNIKAEDSNTILDESYLVVSRGSKQIQDEFTQLMSYSYNYSGQRTSTTITNSQGRKRTITVQYPYDFEDDYLGSDLLRERHMVGQVVASTTVEFKNYLEPETLQKSETHYALQDATQTDSAPVPVKTVVYPNGEDESYSITSTYQYDQYGNLLQSQTEGGLISSYLYGYDYTRPVAEAIEATYAELKAQLDPATIQDKDGNALRQALDGLRTGLPKAHIATTTYDPFYGNVLSVTDPRGRTSTSSYDQLGRLRVVKDHDGYVRQKVEYSLQK